MSDGFLVLLLSLELEDKNLVAPSMFGNLTAHFRGPDSIAVFSIAPGNGTPSRVENVPVNGKTPRNFAIDPTGSWLWAANQESDNIVIFRINHKTGRLTPTGQVLQVASPACVRFVPVP